MQSISADGGNIVEIPALAVSPWCQLSWHVARSAGHIKCHHGDRLACLARTVAHCRSSPWAFFPDTVTYLTSPQGGLFPACVACSSAGEQTTFNSIGFVLHLTQTPVLLGLGCLRLSKLFGLHSQKNLLQDSFIPEMRNPSLRDIWILCLFCFSHCMSHVLWAWSLISQLPSRELDGNLSRRHCVCHTELRSQDSSAKGINVQGGARHVRPQ